MSIEPLTTSDAIQLEFIAECLHAHQPGVMATVFKATGTKVASRLLLKPDGSVINGIEDQLLAQQVLLDAQQTLLQGKSRNESYTLPNGIAEVFLEVINPLVFLAVFGAGYDAIPVVNLAKQLGWYVTIIDNRPGYTTSERFPLADQIIFSEPQTIQNRLKLTPRTVAIVMTHTYKSDLALLRTLLLSDISYIGVLGPKSRTDQLLQEIKSAGLTLTPEQLHRIYAPVGLDIGADSPETIALSIIAEIQAILANRSGGLLRMRPGPIH